MSTHKDEDISNDSEFADLAELDSGDDFTRVMPRSAPLDEQRAADLDALAEIIKRQNEPRTLLGLGIPTQSDSEPGDPDVVSSGPRDVTARDPLAAAGDADVLVPSDLISTPGEADVLVPADLISSPGELDGAPGESIDASEAAESESATAESAVPEGAFTESPVVDQSAFIESPVVDQSAFIESPLVDESAVAESPIARSPVVDESRAHESVLLDASPSESVNRPASAPRTPRSQSATITPPPSVEAVPLELNSWLEANQQLVIAPPVATQPRQLIDSLRPHITRTRSEAPWSMSPERRSEPALASRLVLIGLAFAASVAATVVLANSLLPGRKGTLLVTASGPNQLRIEEAQVLLDGKPVCAQVPCRLEALSPGVHAVSVWAKGYERMASQPIELRGGVESALQLTLTRRDTAALRVDTNVPGLSVRLDGEDRGSAPTTIHQLSPTEHTLRLVGNSAYAPFEQRITLESDRTLTVEPKLVPLIGKLHLEAGAGADGARIEVVRDGTTLELKKLPADLEMTPGGSYHIHASRRNFEDYDSEVAFNEARAEQSLVITLAPRGATSGSGHATLPSTPAPAAPTSPAAQQLPSFLGDTGNGMLNINSIPISRVLLDGRPIGSTPQKVTLSAGAHSLTFVHPTMGRQTLNVNVTAGQSKVAAVRF